MTSQNVRPPSPEITDVSASDVSPPTPANEPAVDPASISPYSSSIVLDGEGQTQNRPIAVQSGAMSGPGRKPKAGPTKHAWRLHWLFKEMLEEVNEDGQSRFKTGSDLARYLHLGKQYVNQVLNIETSGMGGVSADIIEHLMNRVGILPDWFFGEWIEGEAKPSYRDYLASSRRNERRVTTLERQLASQSSLLEEVLERLKAVEDTEGHTEPLPRSAKRNDT